jgi:hypothetical protein
MTSPVDRISGPSTTSTSGKRNQGNTTSLTENQGFFWAITFCQGAKTSFNDFPTITIAATLARGTPVALETNGTVRLARGLASRHIHRAVLHGVLNVDEPLHPRARAMARCVAGEVGQHLRFQAVGRQNTGGIPGMDAGLFDVFHDPGDEHVFPITHRVHVHFFGVLQKAVEAGWATRRRIPGRAAYSRPTELLS